MKVKDLERTANVAWSPKGQSPILLAAGTAAQQLDASFNTSAALELYSLNLQEPGPDLLLKSATTCDQRFHALIWGEQNGGTIIGGCDGGLIQIYNANSLLKNEPALIGRQERHSGHVQTLDFNPSQQNLFATGAGESEIFIWDLNNFAKPMSPGAKSQPLEDVLSVAWNKQVQHILASTFTSKCVIWDLRKENPIIKLTDTVSRIRWKVVAWHPEIATQLCLASEEDHSPIIQLWDLRFATSPLKTLENHQRGVLSVAWCDQDPDLLVSCGKDDRILCWNPNSNQPNGEVLSEIAVTNQWTFDIKWCPRNPAIIACPNYDGHVSIYSLMGGKTQQIQTTNKIADSFPGMDGIGNIQAPVISSASAPISLDLSKPPKWMKRPIGASFGFGGKLIWFQDKHITIEQVVTETELVEKSVELEQALEYGNFIEYCRGKADGLNDQHKKYIWHFLRANFEYNTRVEILNLLGYEIGDINNKLNEHIGKKLINNIDDITEQMNNMNRIDDNFDPFDNIAQVEKKIEAFQIKTGDDTDGLITQALLLGNVEASVELCLKAKRFADALIIAMTGGSDLLARTQHAYLEQCTGYVSYLISALVSEDWASVINNCDLGSWKEALAATLTHSNDETLPLLCDQLGDRLAASGEYNKEAQLCYICAGSFDKLVNSWSRKALNSTKDLLELVELVKFLQKAVERNGRIVQVSGALANLYTQYASLLASQGKLDTALNYLSDSSNDNKVLELKERLSVSLDLKQNLNYKQQSRRGSQRASFSSYTPQGQFNTGLPNAATIQPWQQPAPGVQNYPPVSQNFQPPQQNIQNQAFAPPIAQPPRPTSVGSNHGGGLPQKKYVLDPSVSSNQYGIPASMKPTFQPYQQSPAPAPASLYTPPMNPVNSYPPPPDMGQPALERPQTAAGWNDPPVFNRPAKQFNGEIIMSALHAGTKLWKRNKTKEAQPAPVQPILHPLFGSANGSGDQQQQQLYDNHYNNPHPPQPQLFQPAAPPPPPTANYPNQMTFKQNAIQQTQFTNNNYPTPPPPPAIAHEQPQLIQKPPIPEEHIHMKTVLDELKNHCYNAANNPQTKRKLDDVLKKLEMLYDLLREHKLSPNTLTSLHQLVQLVQNGDYTGGLQLHTQLVSGPDFAQIASFMPGLKVLLQCALQLQVYLR